MTETTILPHPDEKNAPTGECLSERGRLERELMRLEMIAMRRDLIAMPLTATQLALVAMAARQGYLQDPERHWLPKEFETEFLGALRAINYLTRRSFGPTVQACLREEWHEVAAI